MNNLISGRDKSFETITSVLIYNKKTKKYNIGFSLNKVESKLENRGAFLDKYQQHLKKGEIALPGINRKPNLDMKNPDGSISKNNSHHAEVNSITGVWGMEDSGVALVVSSNNACTTKNLHNCAPMMNSYGIAFLNPREVKELLKR
ncbi:MAG: hypothetical protein IPP69_10380 [Flavobacteriales bacterium]|nr:hypothetical protein [Flavobacteriales bacterium]